MLQIMPGVQSFAGLMVGRVYLLEDADGLTLIDAGLGFAAKRIVSQLQGMGRRPQDVKRILVTHAHPDHVGGLRPLQAASGAQVIASQQEKPVIEGQIAVPRRPGNPRPPRTVFKPTPVGRVVGDGDVIAEVLGGLHVVFTPGHAPGHVAFWHPDKRLLFCGDVLFNWPSLRLPYALLTVDMAENIRSVQKIAALNPDMVCFGHGDPLRENTAARLRAFAEKVK